MRNDAVHLDSIEFIANGDRPYTVMTNVVVVASVKRESQRKVCDTVESVPHQRIVLHVCQLLELSKRDFIQWVAIGSKPREVQQSDRNVEH